MSPISGCARAAKGGSNEALPSGPGSRRLRRALFFRAADRARWSFRCACGAASISFDAYGSCLAIRTSSRRSSIRCVIGRLHDRRRRADRGAGRLLDPVAPAAAAAVRRVHHPAAAGHSGDRHRLRLYPDVQFARRCLPLPAARADRRAADLRLRDAVAALHVSCRRYRSARHRRAHADRSGARSSAPAGRPSCSR